MTTDGTPPTSVAASSGGLAGAMAEEREHFYVAPTVEKHFNTVRPQLRAEGSFRLDGHRFAVGSSFILPNTVNELALLVKLRPPVEGDKRKTAARMAIFGHADNTGSDIDNKALSGRRARALHALLVRDVDGWARLYDEPKGSDTWGVQSVQWMLAAMGLRRGRIHDELDASTKEGLKSFQSNNGLSASGENDAPTRKKLFSAYMGLLCVDEKGEPFSYSKEDFLDEGKDPDGKGACQGCGELNPLVVVSKKEADELAKEENRGRRDDAYRNNRRVTIYLFSPKLALPMARWPCPTVDADGTCCQKQLWRNGDERRKSTDRRREHMRGEGTFACRFYDAFARFAPVEKTRRTVALWLHDRSGKRMPGEAFQAWTGTSTVTGRADDEGRALIEDVFSDNRLTVAWGAMKQDEERASKAPNGEPGDAFAYHASIHVDTDDYAEGDEAIDDEALRRLENLGFHQSNLYERAVAFQKAKGLAEKGWPDEETRKALWSSHASGNERNGEQAKDEDTDAPAPVVDLLYMDRSELRA